MPKKGGKKAKGPEYETTGENATADPQKYGTHPRIVRDCQIDRMCGAHAPHTSLAYV